MANSCKDHTMEEVITHLWHYLSEEWTMGYIPNVLRIEYEMTLYHGYSVADVNKALCYLQRHKSILQVRERAGIFRVIPYPVIRST